MILLATLLAVAPPADDPKPMDPHVFADWAVACDNGRRCEAVSMTPDGTDPGSGLGLLVRREAGPAGAVGIDLRSPEGLAGPIRIKLDGRVVAETRLDANGKATIEGVAAATLAAKLPNATAIVVTGADGSTIAKLSPKGSAAALRFIDAAQRRTGTLTALVAKGGKTAASVPAAPTLPTVAAVPLTMRDATPPSDALVAGMRKASQCPADDSGPVSAESSALDANATLVLVSCGAGAYNFTTSPFVVIGGKAAPARFDVDIGEGDTQSDRLRPLLVNAIWNSKLGTLFSYAKGRGIGDCGVSRTFAWDGERFRLIEEKSLGECRGAIAWPTTWRADVRRR